MSENANIKLTIPCQAEFVSVVRLAISGVATRMSFPIEDIEDIKIAVSEACTNVVQHAYTSANHGNIDIECNVLPSKLEIVVKDSGKGFDTSKLESNPKVSHPDERLGMGLGITFMRNLMDEVKINSEEGSGTAVIMAKHKPNGK